MTAAEWASAVREYHALGVRHARSRLSHVALLVDADELAQDVVQGVWLRALTAGEFDVGRFVRACQQAALDAARSAGPIEVRIRSGAHNGPNRGTQREKSRTTSTWPTQIFGCHIGDVVMFQAPTGAA